MGHIGCLSWIAAITLFLAIMAQHPGSMAIQQKILFTKGLRLRRSLKL